MQALLSVSRTLAVAPHIGAKSSWTLRCERCVARWEETTTAEEPLVLGGRSAGYGRGVMQPRRHVLVMASDSNLAAFRTETPTSSTDAINLDWRSSPKAGVKDALVQFDAASVTDQDVKSAVVSNQELQCFIKWPRLDHGIVCLISKLTIGLPLLGRTEFRQFVLVLSTIVHVPFGSIAVSMCWFHLNST